MIALPLLLSGCAWLQARALSPIPAEQDHVIVPASAPLAVVGGQRYMGPAQLQDYMLLRGEVGQAELIYGEAIGHQGQAAIQYHGRRLRQLTEGWAANSGGIRDWGRVHAVDTTLARFHYVPYATAQPGRHCAAFQALWDVPPGNVQKWPGKLIFGYYCAARGTLLKTEVLDHLLAGLRVGFRSRSDHPAPLPLIRAQAAGGQAGYRSFPRLFPIFRVPFSAGMAEDQLNQ